MSFTLVIGGARSGKTRYALEQALAPGAARRVMIATAQALDEEMAQRIARHRAERGEAWATVEAPLDLADAVRRLEAGEAAVVDCLTLWLSNLMLGDLDVAAAVAETAQALAASPAGIVVVTNEVGQGIVPDNALARRFRDEAGWMNQAMAAAADRVVLVSAGLPLVLKG
ncbi:bifunctional adenosylcobinamide kinase/adenosylcobinamide-phosphate guanylyltransferase [Phenylobacterium sp.]|uniref:bifunctional adenosylcobinamide kinase/adenosylcobinamide-phosphate guanylyltransferase n=1 Tax=Phenylobacterium sp. TaxID=1871053 RepID=UPI0035B2BAE1